MSRPLKFTNAADWAAVKESLGWDAAGRPPRGAHLPMPEALPPPSRGWQQAPAPPVGPTKAERARARRVRAILLKYGYGNAPLGLRI